MPQTPDTMFADKGYEGWDKLSAYEKVERMMGIHKTGHEGEDVSVFHTCLVQGKTLLSRGRSVEHVSAEMIEGKQDMGCVNAHAHFSKLVVVQRNQIAPKT